MQIPEHKMAKLFDCIQLFNQTAYQQPHLVCNRVLSKKIFSGDYLDQYIKGETLPTISFFFKVEKLVKYLLKNFIWLFEYLANKIVWVFSKQTFPVTENEQFVLIDSFFLGEKILKDQCFKDSYFPGLSEVLDLKKRPYIYCPKFSGCRKPWVLFEVLKILQSHKIPTITEYQLVTVPDILSLIHCLIMYPYNLLSAMKKLGNSSEEQFLKYALWSGFDEGILSSYARHLYGMHLGEIFAQNLKCISWCENQETDKNFYSGLRCHNPKVLIYGAQLFVWPLTILNVHIDYTEIDFNLVPDVVVVNGPYYFEHSDLVTFRMGPSLRYTRLFKTEVAPVESKKIIVLLSYFDYEIRNILGYLKQWDYDFELVFRFHPATNMEKWTNLLPEKAKIDSGELYDSFQDCRIVIGANTGSLIEAASLGIPVIVLRNFEQLNHNEMPEYGRGIIWDEACNIAELNNLIIKYHTALENKSEKIISIGHEYKKLFFTKPTFECIIKAFDL